ncbi:MAG: hypothetical protein ACSHYF_17065 [Verrucomicrobiaceae bacterium]
MKRLSLFQSHGGLRALVFLLLSALPLVAAPVSINNAGFEEPAQGPGGWVNLLQGWSERDGDDSANSFIENIGGFSAEGAQHVGLSNGYYIWIDTGVVWEADTVYTLKVSAGNRGGHTTAGNATVYGLLSGVDNLGLATAADTAAVLTDPLLVASGEWDAEANVPAGTFGTAPPLIFESGPTPPTGTIVILLGDNSTGGRSHFDNIRLETSSGVDADGDGLPVEWENEHGLDDTDDGSVNPDNGASGDPDGDNRTNLDEFNDETDPQNPDTDMDGSNDGNEFDKGTDPLDEDTDNDGLKDGPESGSGTFVDETDYGSDPLKVDTDGDGRFDGQEVADGSSPVDAASPVTSVVGFGVNFVSGAGDGAPLASGEIAGYPEVAMRGWVNSVAGSIVGDNSSLENLALFDSDGVNLTNTAGTSISWAADTIWQIGNRIPGADATYGGDSKLFTGYIDNTDLAEELTIELSDMPYAAYDVYVYFASDGNDRIGEISISGAGDVELGRYDFTTNASQGGFQLDDYVVTESTDASNPSSQVAIFRSITEGDLKITHTRLGTNSGVAGFQIVQAGPVDTTLRIVDWRVDVSSDQADFTAVNLRNGRTYHLEVGTSLNDFAPLPGSQFDAAGSTEELSLLFDIGTQPVQFFRLKEGMIPTP